MPYSIDRYNGTTLTVVEDGTIDVTTDIKLIGKNYAGYGETQNENMVHMLENFSGTNAPPRPLSGQIWYDSQTKKLKFYDANKWRTTGGAEVSSTEPTGLTEGDFWWDTSNEQLYAWNGSAFVLVGPQGAEGSGTTQMRSRSVRDNVIPVAGSHAIIEAILDDEVIFIISPEEFTLDSSVNPITGFNVIKKGITLVNTGSTGVTSSDHRYWGTSSNSEKLGGQPASNFVQSTGSPEFSAQVNFGDLGFTVGDSNDLGVFINNDNEAYIKNSVGDKIYFQTTSSGTKTPLVISGANIEPLVTGISNIGSVSKKYSTVYATSFDGVATQADTLNVGGTYRSASAASGINTIAARDSAGDLYASLFRGTATSARFADLAEKYLADAEYEVGTVLMIGGENEVTACEVGYRAVGPVSANPAHLMNADLEGGTAIALKGRVPVKVTGTVKKGQRLVAGANGTAQAAMGNNADVFAIALESNNDANVKLVECIIL